ncbi:DUF3574 domain-containing protein [Nostoc sp.]|uniref:DUF3574 domain-containing protein n=1 Tax=Nostoc sp. TaxID=1180 RepID=UPI003FA5377F
MSKLYQVSNNDFQSFLNNVVTPLFPDKLTVFDTNGQYLDSTGTIIEEKSKTISLFFNYTQQNKNVFLLPSARLLSVVETLPPPFLDKNLKLARLSTRIFANFIGNFIVFHQNHQTDTTSS